MPRKNSKARMIPKSKPLKKKRFKYLAFNLNQIPSYYDIGPGTIKAVGFIKEVM